MFHEKIKKGYLQYHLMSSYDAQKREEAAAKLTDLEIWYQVLTKLAVMEMPIDTRVEMIVQTIGDDISMVIAVLEKALDDLSLETEKIKDVLNRVNSEK